MKSKVHLGLLEKNENKIPEMLEILQHCNEEYVPADAADKSNIIHAIHLGGDHLTVERAISAVNAVSDADTSYERLQGLVLKYEDFHCEMNFLQVTNTAVPFNLKNFVGLKIIFHPRGRHWLFHRFFLLLGKPQMNGVFIFMQQQQVGFYINI